MPEYIVYWSIPLDADDLQDLANQILGMWMDPWNIATVFRVNDEIVDLETLMYPERFEK
jgi:hypothetical protein